MKNQLLLFLALVLGVTSCTTTSDVMADRLVQKRKYRSGFYVEHNRNKKHREQVNPVAVKDEPMADVKVPATVEPVAVVEPASEQKSETESVEKKNELSDAFLNKTKKVVKAIHKPLELPKKEKQEITREPVVAGAVSISTAEAISEGGYLRTALICALIALILQVIGFIAIDGGLFHIIAYIFWVAAIVFLILWLIDQV